MILLTALSVTLLEAESKNVPHTVSFPRHLSIFPEAMEN